VGVIVLAAPSHRFRHGWPAIDDKNPILRWATRAMIGLPLFSGMTAGRGRAKLVGPDLQKPTGTGGKPMRAHLDEQKFGQTSASKAASVCCGAATAWTGGARALSFPSS